MKTIRIYLMLLLGFVSFVGCEDDLLNKEPLDKLTPQAFFTSEESDVE